MGFQRKTVSMWVALCFSGVGQWAYADEHNEIQETVQIEDIIVTGEKINRAKFDTGSSVSTMSAQQIEHGSNPLSATDILEKTANVVDTGLGNDLPTVRGVDGSGPAVGAVAYLAGSRPRLNMSVDGRTSNYNELAFGTKSLWDMKQVEVYRGPQSYAHGRNAIAGAVVMTSNDPTNEWEGAAKLGWGNQHSKQIAAMISGPLVKDELSFRLSVDRQQRKSFVDLMPYVPVGDPRRFETTTTRAKLLWTPSEHPELYSRLTFNHVKSRAPQSETENNPASLRYTPQRPVFETSSASGIWDVSWQFSDNWKLENKTVYSKVGNDRLTLPAPAGAPASLKANEFQIEPTLRFTSTGGQYKGLLGLFYFRANQDDWVDIRTFHNVFKDKTDTKALFGEFTWSPTAAYDITLSARYEHEHHERKGGSDIFSINRDKTYRVFLPKAEFVWKPNDQNRLGFKAGRGYNPGGAGVTFGSPYVSYEYEAEYIRNYELFHRWRSADKRLEIGSNLFYNDYKDMQLPYYLGANSVVIRNADKVATYGAEMEANWQASNRWQLYGSLGLLKTDIKKFSGSGIEGNRLARAPAYTFSLGSSYQWPQGWEVGGDFRFTGKYYSNYTNNEIGQIGAYGQTNIYAAYHFKRGQLKLYADNVFNSGKKTFIPATDRVESINQRPRLVGVTAEYRF